MERDTRWKSRAGEAFVIVTSILIAFSIDTWWSSRQEADAREALVELLIQDIEADLAGLQRQAERGDSLMARNLRLLDIGLGIGEAPELEALPLLSRDIWTTNQIDPSLAAYEIVLQTTAWSRIPPPIKVTLSEYMRGPFSVDRNRDLEATRGLMEVAGRHGGSVLWQYPESDKTLAGEAVLGFLRDPAAQTWLLAHRGGLADERSWQRRWLGRLPPIVEELRALR